MSSQIPGIPVLLRDTAMLQRPAPKSSLSTRRVILDPVHRLPGRAGRSLCQSGRCHAVCWPSMERLEPPRPWLELLCGAAIRRANVPNPRSLHDPQKTGVAKAEQEADGAGGLRPPISIRRVVKLNVDVVWQQRPVMVPRAGEKKPVKGALRDQSQEAWLNAGLLTRGLEDQLLQSPCIAVREGNVQARCTIVWRKPQYDAIRTDEKDAIYVSRSRGGEHSERDEKRDAFHASDFDPRRALAPNELACEAQNRDIGPTQQTSFLLHKLPMFESRRDDEGCPWATPLLIGRLRFSPLLRLLEIALLERGGGTRLGKDLVADRS